MPETVYSVQLVGTGRTMIVFGSMVNAQSYADQYNEFHEPETEQGEVEVRAWTVLANAHKYKAVKQ